MERSSRREMKREVSVKMPRPRSPSCPPGSAKFRLWRTALAVGAGSYFQVFLDAVVDNLFFTALPTLLPFYGSKEKVAAAWEEMVATRGYGLVFGSIIPIFVQTLGRKVPLLIGTLISIVGLIMMWVTNVNEYGLTFCSYGRFIHGVGSGVNCAMGQVMLTDIPSLQNRGRILASLIFWACAGELLGMAISMEYFVLSEHWNRTMASIPLFLTIGSLFFICISPESPRFLFEQKKEEQARKALLYYQDPHEAEMTMNELMEARPITQPKETETAWGRYRCLFYASTARFTDGTFIRPLLIGCFVQTFVHLNDWAWISYSTPIFENFGMTYDKAQLASLFMAIPQVIVSIVMLRFFDNFSRRNLLIGPTGCSIVIAILTVVSAANRSWFGGKIGYVIAVFASVDLSVAAISGESAFTIVPELFLPQDKVMGTSLCGALQNLFGAVVTDFLLTAFYKHGLTFVLLPFVFMNVVYCLVTWKHLPETGGKTAQEVATNFSSEFPGTAFFLSLRKHLSHSLSDFPPIIGIVVLLLQGVFGLSILHFAFGLMKSMNV